MMLTTVVERKHSTLNLLAVDSWPRIIADCANLRNLPPDSPHYARPAIAHARITASFRCLLSC